MTFDAVSTHEKYSRLEQEYFYLVQAGGIATKDLGSGKL